jgi:hypothetical protein
VFSDFTLQAINSKEHMMHKHHVTKACVEVEEESIALYSSEVNNNIEVEATLAPTGGRVSVETKQNKISPVHSSISQTVLLANHFWLRKITTDPHILAHLNKVSG